MTEDDLKISAQKLGMTGDSTKQMTGNRRGKFMRDDKGNDRDNQWGVGFELGQKAYYCNYSSSYVSTVQHLILPQMSHLVKF